MYANQDMNSTTLLWISAPYAGEYHMLCSLGIDAIPQSGSKDHMYPSLHVLAGMTHGFFQLIPIQFSTYLLSNIAAHSFMANFDNIGSISIALVSSIDAQISLFTPIVLNRASLHEAP